MTELSRSPKESSLRGQMHRRGLTVDDLAIRYVTLGGLWLPHIRFMKQKSTIVQMLLISFMLSPCAAGALRRYAPCVPDGMGFDAAAGWLRRTKQPKRHRDLNRRRSSCGEEGRGSRDNPRYHRNPPGQSCWLRGCPPATTSKIAARFHLPNDWISDNEGRAVAPKNALDRPRDVIATARRNHDTYVA